MVLSKIIPGVFLAALVTNANALEVDGKLSLGYDDNPIKLADTLDPEGGWFLDTKLKAKQVFGDYRLRASLQNRTHDNSIDNADFSLVKIDGRYKRKYKIAGKKLTSHVLLKYNNKNKTYVKRSTGEVGTFSGQKIDDRYDYDSWGIEAGSILSLNKKLKTGLELHYLNKDYNDYNIKGLSNLDYDQYKLINDWKYKYNDVSKFKLSLSTAQRIFDDKREKDLSGSSIDDTDLEYDYYTASIAHYYKFSPILKSKIELKYEERRDSGSGYYDTDLIKLSAELDYEINKGLNLVSKVIYQDRDYLNDIPFEVDEDDEEHPDKQGHTIKVNLEKELGNIKNMPALFFVGLQYDSYDSKDPAYEYDRIQVFTGINLIF